MNNINYNKPNCSTLNPSVLNYNWVPNDSYFQNDITQVTNYAVYNMNIIPTPYNITPQQVNNYPNNMIPQQVINYNNYPVPNNIHIIPTPYFQSNNIPTQINSNYNYNYNYNKPASRKKTHKSQFKNYNTHRSNFKKNNYHRNIKTKTSINKKLSSNNNKLQIELTKLQKKYNKNSCLSYQKTPAFEMEYGKIDYPTFFNIQSELYNRITEIKNLISQCQDVEETNI